MEHIVKVKGGMGLSVPVTINWNHVCETLHIAL